MASAQGLCDNCGSINFEMLSIGPGEWWPDSTTTTEPPERLSVNLGFLKNIRTRSTDCALCHLVTSVADQKWGKYLEYQSGPWRKHSLGQYPENESVGCALFQLPYAKVNNTDHDLNCYRLEVKMAVPPLTPPDFTLLTLQPCERPIPNVKTFCDDQSSTILLPGGRLIEPAIDTRLLKFWLKTCISRHGDACAQPYWLQPGDKVSCAKLRLINVKEKCLVDRPTQDCSYAALSYVWGAPQSAKYEWTTSNNIQLLSLPGALSEDNIPPTIHDSMSLAAEIGCRYLWADRYCIIQDDDKDKAEQIPKMDSIYASALVTIVAASGTGAYDGLAGFNSKLRKPVQIGIDVTKSLSLLMVPEINEVGYRHCKWRTRGWTLQEKVCSKRVLVVTDDLVYWTCETEDWFENMILERLSDRRRLITLSKAPFGYTEPYESGYQKKFDLQHLQVLVSQYTHRQLTNESDALDAFTGLLSRLNRCTGYGFYWGHPIHARFSESLSWDSAGLIRRTEHCLFRHQNGTKYETPFPSWSWLGWKGGRSLTSPPPCTVVPELEFFRLDIHGKAERFLHSRDNGSSGLSNLGSTEANSAPWKGNESGIPTDRLCKTTFRDSGRLLFWTSHAIFHVKKGIRRYTSVYQVDELTILDDDGHIVGTSNHSEAVEAKEDTQYSFIVVSRVLSEAGTAAGNRRLNVLMVKWEDEKHRIASRICAGVIEEQAWVKVKRDWILCTLT